MSRTVLYQTVVPDYRMGLFRELKRAYSEALTFACGEESFAPTTRTCAAAAELVQPLRNRFIFGRRLLWQGGLMEKALQADLVIGEFCLRAPSTWRLLHKRHRMGRPTVFWGHVAGSQRASQAVRRWMLNRCSGFIAYMPRERARLQAEFPALPTWVAPNAVLSARDCFPADTPAEERQDVLYVGRLVSSKKVELLLEGFCAFAKRRDAPAGVRLQFVGTGPSMATLQARASHHGLADRVGFSGHVSEVSALREQYARAFVAVSPGYVGLAATQAFGFGVPMLIADKEPHSPEIELCVAGENCLMFEAGNAEDLGAKLLAAYEARQPWAARRAGLSRLIRENYSFEAMLVAFQAVIRQYCPTIALVAR